MGEANVNDDNDRKEIENEINVFPLSLSFCVRSVGMREREKREKKKICVLPFLQCCVITLFTVTLLFLIFFLNLP